jgi:hypothetical protein
VTGDRISYAQLSHLTGSRDRPAAHAVENAVHGINTTERTIRQAAAKIRSALDETVQRLDQGLRLNDADELQRLPADFDRAVTLRQHHWQVLGALLTDAELETLTPATKPAP